MAKKNVSRGSRPHALDRVFTDVDKKVKEPARLYCWAIRQRRGPEEHEPLVIRSHDILDAQRQWFNYYNLTMQTHRYLLQVVKLPEGHDAEPLAITCGSPRMDQSITLEEMASQSYIDVQGVLEGKAV